MSFHQDHNHTQNIRAQLRSGKTPETYAAVVGTILKNSEKPITGPSGDHLKFYLQVGNGFSYQVDVNTQSSNGSEIGVYIAEQDVAPIGTNPSEPFGPPAYGVFPSAQLSYQSTGLTDADFSPMPYERIDGQLRADLQVSQVVSAYGMTYDDGGSNGKGVHDIHFNQGSTNKDGAVLIYSVDALSGKPKRTWYFFKFQADSIG